jgi:hypothetical protein
MSDFQKYKKKRMKQDEKRKHNYFKQKEIK